MDLDCEHGSIFGKTMSPFGHAVMEIFNFYLGCVTYGPPCTFLSYDRSLGTNYNKRQLSKIDILANKITRAIKHSSNQIFCCLSISRESEILLSYKHSVRSEDFEKNYNI